jgi:uncharacterized protein YpbB
MGGTRMTSFGKEILALILEYRHQKGMELPKNVNDEIAAAGLSSKEISLKMFMEGKSVAEIARTRALTVSTIENHLAHFVETGDLDVFQLIEREKYEIIRNAILDKKSGETTSDIKNRLGARFSYSEIRLVIANMN